ncbi:MAG: CPBP family intramembrane metalloprotease [Polyangiaceae bacterium]|nr:CPBP family intramembrane metalloprotease [Polyangiaceae bacterium]
MMRPEQQPSDNRPPVWPAFVGFAAVLFAAQILGIVVLGTMFAIHLVTTNDAPDSKAILASILDFVTSPQALVASAAVSSLTLVGASLIGARLSKTPATERLRLAEGRVGWGRAAVASVGVVGISWVFGGLISALGLEGIGILHLFEKAFAKMSPVYIALSILFIGVTAPIGEEFFFRGFMQTRLAARWKRPLAIATAAAAFGLMHMDPIQGTYAFFVGLYLGYVTEATGSIRIAIAGHAINNCLSVIFASGLAGTADPHPSTLEKWGAPLIGLVAVTLGVIALKTAKTTQAQMPLQMSVQVVGAEPSE